MKEIRENTAIQYGDQDAENLMESAMSPDMDETNFV